MSSVRHVFLASILSILSASASAENVIRASAPVLQSKWVAQYVEGEWIAGQLYSCTAWLPKASSQETGVKFTQTRTCQQDETREIRKYEQNNITKKIRNETVSSESRTFSIAQSQEAMGATCSFSPVSPYSFIAIAKDSTYTEGRLNDNLIWAGGPINDGYYTGAEKTSGSGGTLNYPNYYFYEICKN
ncbi:hypothetical protein P5704_027595 (plasmid) [Pseudomonas sp. FeN3W]|nr:hypothetical protein P5704_027595 [Pseudomonas sp. FeN3W]